MKDTDLAYIAGLLDGEGSISLAGLIGKPWRKRSDFSLRVRIHNTRRPVLDWVSTTVGGKVYTASNHPKDGYNKVYQWLITGAQAMSFLELVKPYLKIKNTQVDIASEFQNTKEVIGAKRQFRFGIPPDVTQHRTKLYEQMKSANRKGTSPIL